MQEPAPNKEQKEFKKWDNQVRTYAHQYSVPCNKQMDDMIRALSKQRRRTFSNTIRMLITMGYNTYMDNKAQGVKTGKQSQALREKHLEEAGVKPPSIDTID